PKEQLVAAVRGLRYRLRADVAARAGAVLDQDLLPQPRAERIGDDARAVVGDAAGRERHYDADRLCRIVLRMRLGRDQNRYCPRETRSNQRRTKPHRLQPGITERL